MRRPKLATLVSEQRSGAPLRCGAMDNSTTLWFVTTWSAPFLPGEEGALLLVALLHCSTEGEGAGEEVIGWVALPLDELGELHAQLQPPPLPLSSAEARNPQARGKEPLEVRLHWFACRVGW